MQILNLNEEPQHIPTLTIWHQQEWAHLNPGSGVEKRLEKMMAYLGAELVPSTFIAKQTELMGSAAIVAHDMDTRPELTPWLASVFVAPEYRNNGVGSRLVQHVMQQAEQAGIGTLYLFTPDRAGFYRRLGWQVLSEEEYRGYPVTVMQARLNRLPE